MLLEFIKNTCWNGKPCYAGDIKDVSGEDAVLFLSLGKAVKVSDVQARADLPPEWDSRRKYRVAMLSYKDYAGSGFHRAQAIRTLTDFDVRLICVKPHCYGYYRDMTIEGGKEGIATAQKLLDECDLIHFKGDDLPESEMWGLRIPEKPMCITVGGSGFRRKKYYNDTIQHYCPEFAPVADYRRIPVRTALSCDLLYPEFGGKWSPNVMDCERTSFTWRDPGTEYIIIGTSPGAERRELKGTDDILLPALDMLAKRGRRLEVRIITGCSNAECLELKKTCHLFFDQGHVGFWGMSAVEAAAFGIPVIVYIPAFVRKFANKDLDGCPFITFAEDTPESCGAAIDAALSSNLERLALETRRYAVDKLGYLACADRWSSLYKKTLDAGPVDLGKFTKESHIKEG